MISIGGDVCESNTPETFCAPHNGFEGRGPHQGSIRLRMSAIVPLPQYLIIWIRESIQESARFYTAQLAM